MALHWDNVKFSASSTFKLKKKINKSVTPISVNTSLKPMKVGLAPNTGAKREWRVCH